MPERGTLFVSLSGPDSEALIRGVVDRWFADETPAAMRIDSKERKPAKDWLAQGLKSTGSWMTVRFGEDEFESPWLSYAPGGVIKVQRFDWPIEVQPTLEILQGLPFELAVGGEIFPEWADGRTAEQTYTFADGHNAHGWMCAFRGAGHDRLVSRRWLERGPWKLHRGGGDTSLVQFHDLDADWRTALDQALVGHRRMGISDEGGFLQTGYQWSKDLDGDYDETERRLRFVVAERGVSPVEMLDACATRHYQVLGADRPIEHVAFVFAEAALAQRYLHELWLRDLECWAYREGRAERVDREYSPAPDLPAWVTRGS